MNNAVLFLLAFWPSLTLANEVSEHSNMDVHIPSSIFWAIINFAIYVAVMVFVLRKPIRQYFADREQSFKQALVKAQSARQDAENRKREITERLQKLESSASESLDSAKAEAEALKAKILKEAEELSKKLKEEAHRSAQHEVERAKVLLREELLQQSLEISKSLMAAKMADPDQKRLQTEFVNKIQVVR